MPVKILILAFLLFASIFTLNQFHFREQDSYALLLKEIFEKVRQNSVFREQVNWKELEHQVIDIAGTELTAENFKDKVRLLYRYRRQTWCFLL